MYSRLGYEWAGSLLGFIGLACCGIPFFFWKYGARIRQRSKYAYGGDDEELPPAGGPNDVEKNKGAVDATGQPLHADPDDLRRAQSYVSNP